MGGEAVCHVRKAVGSLGRDSRGGRGRREVIGLNEYRATRAIRDVDVLSSGDPERIPRRAKNKVVGRALFGPAQRLWR